MTIIDAEKFLTYLIFSKHIDGLTCGEVKEAIEMCKIDNVLDKIKWLIEQYESEIEKCAEDRRNMPTSLTKAFITAKIGVYGKVIADLKELIESEDRHE